MLLQHKLKRTGLAHKVAEEVSLTYMYPYIPRVRSSYGMFFNSIQVMITKGCRQPLEVTKYRHEREHSTPDVSSTP